MVRDGGETQRERGGGISPILSFNIAAIPTCEETRLGGPPHSLCPHHSPVRTHVWVVRLTQPLVGQVLVGAHAPSILAGLQGGVGKKAFTLATKCVKSGMWCVQCDRKRGTGRRSSPIPPPLLLHILGGVGAGKRAPPPP